MTFSINLSSLNGSNGFRLDGEATFNFSSQSISTAGDVNGDGFDDVIVGATGANPNGNLRAGSSYVVFGQASGFSATMDLSSLDGSNGFRLDGETDGDSSGSSVSTAGDVNGDGFDDVIVGASFANLNGNWFSTGSGYVVFGKADFSAEMNLSILDGNNGFRLDGVTLGDQTGNSVSKAGDVNGDGFDDVIVGAHDAGPNGTWSGSSYVVFGQASGFSAAMDLSSLNGSNGFRLDGEAAYNRLGFSVSTAGDVNGDGFDDLIVGALGASSNGDYSGSSYVVFGQASGFSAAMDLSSLDGSNGFRLDGEKERDYLSDSVSTAGDVNDDGFDDLIVGAGGADPNGESSGSSYVVFGQASGFSATMDLSSLNGSNGFRLDGAERDFSGHSVSTAGDVNDDGFDDLIVGALGADPNGSESGSSYVVFGKASGFSAAMDLSTLNGSNGFRLDGEAEDDFSGRSVSNAGDVNGDGFDDLIVGADGADTNGDYSGSSYVIFGRSDFVSWLPEILGTSGDDTLTGTVFVEHFKAGDGNDKLIGRGGADIFEGDAGNDKIQVADLSFASVDGGAGIDVLHLAGTSLNLNLADFGDRISDIEIISLYSQGDQNSLTLTAADVRNLSTTTNTLKVNGNAGDHIIVADSGWIDGGNRGDGYYHEYTQDDAVLLIGQNLTVDFVATFSINLSSLNGSNGFRLEGETAGDGSGRSVSNAGDVNGDGFDDLIVGAPNADPNGPVSGSSYVVFGKASGFSAAMNLSSLNGSNGFRLDGEATYDFSGHSVSNVGDVNGDGFDDLIVGAPYAGSNGTWSGSSYVVFGQASGFNTTVDLSTLNGSNGFRLDGETAGDGSGFSVSTAGDVNGDGFDDVIVGALFTDTNGNDSGSSYVVFGKASGFSATMNLSSLNGSNGFRLDGKVYDFSGTSVSNAGDVNGDGFDDLIVGADGADSNSAVSGSSYVVFGKASGFSAAMDLSSLNGSNGFRLDGEAAFDYSGRSVSTAGDVNGDGFDDLIVGAWEADPNGFDSGSSYVVFGQASGFGAEMDLSSLDGSNGFRLDGEMASDRLGYSVSTAGDVNGDGFDDLIVGAPGASSNGDYSGSSYVVFGKASGFSAAMNLSTLNGSNGFRLDGGAAYDASGVSVSTAGDVNGDGFDDLIVGDPGTSYIIFGRSDFGSSLPEILGTTGDDILKGTTAAERFKAGDGNDKLIGRGGADILDGGTGDDKIQVADLSFALVNGGTGIDVLHLAGTGLNLNLADFGDRISDIEIISLYSQGASNTLTLTATDLFNLSTTTNTLKVNGNAGGHIIVEDSGWIDGGNRGGGYYHVYTQGDAVLLVGQNLTVDFVAA